MSGAATASIGSFGKIGVPSGTAQTSPVKRSSASASKNPAGVVANAGSERR